MADQRNLILTWWNGESAKFNILKRPNEKAGQTINLKRPMKLKLCNSRADFVSTAAD
jgi:hypothetical protein